MPFSGPNFEPLDLLTLWPALLAIVIIDTTKTPAGFDSPWLERNPFPKHSEEITFNLLWHTCFGYHNTNEDQLGLVDRVTFGMLIVPVESMMKLTNNVVRMLRPYHDSVIVLTGCIIQFILAMLVLMLAIVLLALRAALSVLLMILALPTLAMLNMMHTQEEILAIQCLLEATGHLHGSQGPDISLEEIVPKVGSSQQKHLRSLRFNSYKIKADERAISISSLTDNCVSNEPFVLSSASIKKLEELKFFTKLESNKTTSPLREHIIQPQN